VPDVDFDVGDGPAGGVVGDSAVHVRYVAALVFVNDGVSQGTFGGAVAPEGAENLERVRLRRGGGEKERGVERTYGSGGRLIGGFVGEGVCDFVDEGFEAEDVLEELAFVTFAVRHSAGFV
jgi:hypothetical protein